MKKRFLLIVLVMMLVMTLAPSTILGQDEKSGANDAVDACTAEQINAMKPIVLPYARGYEQITETLQTVGDQSQVDQLITLTNQLQISWWTGAVPQLPDCAFAHSIALTFGRLLDETLLAVIYFRVGAAQDGTAHVEAMTTLSQEVLSMSAELQAAAPVPAATEEATAEATAEASQ